jgi:DNA-binding response OmpR family regulator
VVLFSRFVVNRIALVEDHERVAALICKAFEGTGIQVEVFDRIARARAAIEQLSYSALVVDRGLPDGDGLEFVRKLRAGGCLTPCLMLTARDALRDRVEGLEAGADDYLVKPFSMEELVARVRALLRRPAVLHDLAPEYAGLQVMASESSMRCGEESIVLAPAELQIMLTLVKAQGRTVRRTALEAAGWGLSEPVTPNALDVALHRLRKKVAAIGSTVAISNLRGHGYALAGS